MIHPQMKKHFVMFSRNGRWGTCGGCPTDSNGNIYPEFCRDTARYDHQLPVESLAVQHVVWLRELNQEKEERT